MNVKSKIMGAAMSALGLVSLSGAAHAVSLTPPGERAGLDLAAPLPQGVYFVDIGILGGDPLDPSYGASSFNGNVPVLAWSTPWDILGGHIQFLGAIPFAEAGFNGTNPANRYTGLSGHSTNYVLGLYNEFLAAQIAWNLGNGWAVSYLAGVYLPGPASTWSSLFATPTAPGGVNPFGETVFHQMLAVSYHNNGWNFTSNVQYGIASNTPGSAGSGLCNGFGGSCQLLWGDYFNYDVALTHTFGKWEVGAVGYGSFDTSNTFINSGNLRGWNPTNTGAACTSVGISARNNSITCGKQSQFALGGLVGYNFGPVITQFILANDVYEQNYGRYNTQFIAHVIVPLWNPETPKAVVAKY